MTTAAAIWDIILAAADRDEAVRQALRDSIPVPQAAKERTWARIKPLIAEPVEAQAAVSTHGSAAIPGSRGGNSGRDSATPGPGGRVPAGACEGSR